MATTYGPVRPSPSNNPLRQTRGFGRRKTGSIHTAIIPPPTPYGAGRMPDIMPPNIAEQSLQGMDSTKLVKMFENLLGQASNTEISYEAVAKHAITRKMDLGTAYAYMRCVYRVLTKCCQEHRTSSSLAEIQKMARRYRADREALVQSIPLGRGQMPKKIITDSKDVLPRRLWDLHAGRVVHTVHLLRPGCKPCLEDNKPKLTAEFWAVSHSWTDDMERRYMPVNQQHWKVPLPVGVSLEKIREEILEFSKNDGKGVEYCWLDLICLRQSGPPAQLINPDEEREEEKLRNEVQTTRKLDEVEKKAMEDEEFWHKAQEENNKERVQRAPQLMDGIGNSDFEQTKVQKAEQRIDVPTIGNVYTLATKVVRYLDGIGKAPNPVEEETPVMELPDRHWLRRAWTLQEGSSVNNTLHGGLFTHPETPEHRQARAYVQAEVDKMRDWLKSGSYSGVLHLVRDQMRFRTATKEVDKIAGLNYLLGSARLPVYNPTEDQDVAWASSVREMSYVLKLELLFNFQHPAEKDIPCWAPSWSSLMNCSSPQMDLERPTYGENRPPNNTDLSVSGLERHAYLKYRAQLSMPCFLKFVRFEIKDERFPIQIYDITCDCDQGDSCSLGTVQFFSPHACQLIKDGIYCLVSHCQEARGKLTEKYAWVVGQWMENKIPQKESCFKKVGIVIPLESEVTQIDEHLDRHEQEFIFV